MKRKLIDGKWVSIDLEAGDAVRFLPLRLNCTITKTNYKNGTVDLVAHEGLNGDSWLWDDNDLDQLTLRNVDDGYCIRIEDGTEDTD